ncbi:MAG: hypothetical protein ACOYM3_24345 [Terrimicrobiaceae bacterium]
MSLAATGTQLPWHDPGAAEEAKCCCGSTCCMYPADMFGTGYDYDDLPETLMVDGVLYTKTTPANYGGVTGDIFLEGLGWVWQRYDHDEGDYSSSNRCLITGDGNFTPGDDAVEDQFAATYNGRAYLDSDPFTRYPVDGSTQIASRTQLCEWHGVISTMNLIYDSVIQKWTASCGVYTLFAGTKTGNQDTPIGTYAGTALNPGLVFPFTPVPLGACTIIITA